MWRGRVWGDVKQDVDADVAADADVDDDEKEREIGGDVRKAMVLEVLG